MQRCQQNILANSHRTSEELPSLADEGRTRQPLGKDCQGLDSRSWGEAWPTNQGWRAGLQRRLHFPQVVTYRTPFCRAFSKLVCCPIWLVLYKKLAIKAGRLTDQANQRNATIRFDAEPSMQDWQCREESVAWRPQKTSGRRKGKEEKGQWERPGSRYHPQLSGYLIFANILIVLGKLLQMHIQCRLPCQSLTLNMWPVSSLVFCSFRQC